MPVPTSIDVHLAAVRLRSHELVPYFDSSLPPAPRVGVVVANTPMSSMLAVFRSTVAMANGVLYSFFDLVGPGFFVSVKDPLRPILGSRVRGSSDGAEEDQRGLEDIVPEVRLGWRGRRGFMFWLGMCGETPLAGRGG